MNNIRNVTKNIANDIVSDQKQILEQAIAYMAQKTSEDWTRVAKKVMDDYYADYDKTTQRYKQTFSMRDTVVPVLKRTSDGFEAGVEFDFERMSHQDITDTGEYWILNNFMYGYHGNENYTLPDGTKILRNIYRTTPHAKFILDEYYKNYDSQMDQYFDEGVKLAKLYK